MRMAFATTFGSWFTSWALSCPRASNLHLHWRCRGDDRRTMVRTRLPQSAYYGLHASNLRRANGRRV